MPKQTLFALAIASVTLLTTTPSLALELIGQFQAKEHVNLVAQVPGVIEDLRAESGDPVTRQAVLVRIHQQDFQLDLSKQQANLALAQADLELKKALYQRYQALIKKNSLSQNELDLAHADFQAAKATALLAKISVEQAQLSLARTAIKSPIAGYVTQQMVDVGSWVDEGTALYRLASIDRLIVRLYASEHELSELQVGQSMRVWSESVQDRQVIGKIARIGVELDSEAMAYPIEIDIPNPQRLFKPGMSVYGSTELAVVPVSTEKIS